MTQCQGTAYATAAEYREFWRVDTFDQLDAAKIAAVDAEIDLALELTASNIDIALATVDACSCSLPVWATNFLKKLNIIEAASLPKIACGPTLDTTMREIYLEWVDDWLVRIMEGTVDICGGTGKDTPNLAIAEIGSTPFNKADIVLNRIMRDRTS